jgi:hypothetical protein
VLAAWLILPELYRPPDLNWSQPSAAGEPLLQRAAAKRAARLGIIRGDLWAQFALTYRRVTGVSDGGPMQPASYPELQQAHAAAERALRLSPHEAKVWLLLAAVESRIRGLDPAHQPEGRASAALKMAYYTGQNELELAPARLMVAAQPGVLADEELRQLVRDELRTILTRKTELKPAIVAAYREGSSAVKALIEEVVSTQDPYLLKWTRSEAGVR